VATHTLLDSLHYLHIDFSLLESMNQRWTAFSEAIWRDAQERITELLHYLQMPVGAMSASATAQTATAAAAAAATAANGGASAPAPSVGSAAATSSPTTPREAVAISSNDESHCITH